MPDDSLMTYGKIKELLNNEYSEFSNDVVVIESPFLETTRSGLPIRNVYLGITTNKFIVARVTKTPTSTIPFNLELKCIYPLEVVVLTVFKQTRRQALKASFKNKMARYYELGKCDNRNVFWKLWCTSIIELKNNAKIWPFTTTPSLTLTTSRYCWDNLIECIEVRKLNREKYRWKDKELYLGGKRDVEDRERPAPVAGLGTNDDTIMRYIKPKETEGDMDMDIRTLYTNEENMVWDYDVYTYTGQPTSNITYMSIVNTVGTSKLVKLLSLKPFSSITQPP